MKGLRHTIKANPEKYGDKAVKRAGLVAGILHAVKENIGDLLDKVPQIYNRDQLIT